jgi:hypothetical protein
MDAVLLWCSLGMSFLSIFLAAGCVVACSKLGLRVTRALNRGPRSNSTLQRLEADQVALSSSLETIATTVKRMASRKSMQDFRASGDAPPRNASKVDLRKHYGLLVDGPEFAKRQLSLVPQE